MPSAGAWRLDDIAFAKARLGLSFGALLAGLGRVLAKALAWAMLGCGLFYLATIIGGLMGTNAKWQPPENGVTIFVETNDFHTSLILPAQAEGVDWHQIFPPEDSTAPPLASNYVAIGWGQRDFYLETEQLADIKPTTFIRAAIGSDATLMHVYHLRDPRVGQYLREITVSYASYRQMVRDIQNSIALPDSGPLIAIKGYGRNDVFYAAQGRYSLIESCNSWTGRILRNAGVRIGIWTPTAHSVMRWFPLGVSNGVPNGVPNAGFRKADVRAQQSHPAQ